jgi:hypothetical protein
MMHIPITTDLQCMADLALEAVRADPDIYQRGSALVHVVAVTEAERKSEQRWKSIAQGTPTIRVLPIPVLRTKLSRLAQWTRHDARLKKAVDARPDGQTVEHINAVGNYPGIRPLEGIAESPVFRLDGSIFQTPGYDDATGYLYLPSIQFPPIPERPSRNDAREAMRFFEEELFVDFPHKDRNHRASLIATVLTAIARPAIDGCVPVTVFDANVRGSGKGLQSSVVSIIAYGREVEVTPFPADNPDHMRKTLFSLARSGVPMILFDNLETGVPFAGGALEAAITSRSIRDRILASSEAPAVPFSQLVAVTGNNLTIGGDMPRRCIVCRLESDEQDPAKRAIRSYKYPERAGSDKFKRWCMVHRGELVAKALTILRAHALANPTDGEIEREVGVMESFGGWVRMIASAVVWAGGGNPLLTRMGMDGEVDQEVAPLDAILEGLERLDPTGKGMTTSAIITQLYKPDLLKGEVTENHDGFDGMREGIEALTQRKPGFPPDAQSLGRQLQGRIGRNVGGRKLAKADHRNVKRWIVRKIGVAPSLAIAAE